MAMPRMRAVYWVLVAFAAFSGLLCVLASFENLHLLAAVALCGCCGASLTINRNRMHLRRQQDGQRQD